ncbi:MAG: YceI family protein [Candidatus Kaiserbacteria bacterium GW2011_GWA2_49_19]|uniref:YceI family protein n=1 Tax=Candidatus Kaiserbacteria bacterium GW2011_GWA2_49_19 TaxID=1618669 RepID=A0A0G1VPZ2_9BACT|nr:MAG: YceI family protein [Candidatus Kaiserbacteria bacterium GW2011_GWA2_49_19]
MPSKGQQVYVFGPKGSGINGSVAYTLIGRYKASFEDFNGAIDFDPSTKIIRSVSLKIKTASLHSHFSALDHIVMSKRLLDAGQFPVITFESDRIDKKKNGYWVSGQLEVRGARQQISFPFVFEGPEQSPGGQHGIKASGQWEFNRKDFGLVWSRRLDKGGIIVGDQVTVDWQVVAYQP